MSNFTGQLFYQTGKDKFQAQGLHSSVKNIFGAFFKLFIILTLRRVSLETCLK
jgi:hypothetical protein